MPYVPGWLKHKDGVQYTLLKRGKPVFFTFTSLILVCSVFLFLLSAVCLYTAHNLSTALACVAAGVTVIVVIFGDIGVARNIPLLIWVFAVFLGFIAVYHLAAIAFVASGVEDDKINRTIYVTLQHRMNWYDEDEIKKKRLDKTHVFHKCCGVDGPTDFYDNIVYEYIPDSCCPERRANCSLLEAFQKSCRQAMFEYVKLLSWIAIGLEILQILLMLATMILTLCYWWVLNHQIEEEEKRRAQASRGTLRSRPSKAQSRSESRV